MSWNGTVRCSFCGERKHNRASCPQLKTRMDEIIKANPDDWRAQEYFEKKKRRSVRKCGYCAETGHNRSTCPETRTDKQQFIEKNVQLREEVLNWLKQVGLGIGTLVRYKHWARDVAEYRQVLGLVKGIRWQNIKMQSMRGGTFTDSGIAFLECTPVDSMNERDLSTLTCSIEIMSTIPTRAITKQVPAGWLSSTDEATLQNIENTLKEDDMNYTRRHTLKNDTYY